MDCESCTDVPCSVNDHYETLIQIAEQLTGIDTTLLSTAERNIANILKQKGILHPVTGGDGIFYAIKKGIIS